MDYICTKLKPKSRNDYRKILSSGKLVFPEFDLSAISVTPYQPGTVLEEDALFSVANAKSQAFAVDLMNKTYKTQDFDAIKRPEVHQIDYLFVLRENSPFVFFQNFPRTKLVAKKRIYLMGESFVYRDDWEEITIRDVPDAVYDKTTDTLYFHKLESVTGIFAGIDQLYREATQEETEAFLDEDFISLKDGFSAAKVKTANRKRIALAAETLKKLNPDQRKQMSDYIGEYCPNLKTADSTFEIASEQNLKMLLYGIEQRFYTTLIGDEKRLANSIVSLS